MNESRLFKIVYYLLDKGHATAPWLAEQLEVSVRTIYRDIDALSGAGIPVYAETGRNGGIHLMNNFVLDKAVLSEAQKQEILTALKSINAVQNIKDSDTLNMLSAIFHVTVDDWLEVDFSRWGNQHNDNEKFALLKSAVIHRKAAKITYAGSRGIISERKIQPLKLMYKSRAWYVKAYCTKKKEYRIFKLTRILNLEILNEGFSDCSFPEQQSDSQCEYNQIILRFPNEMAHRVYDEFDEREVARQENGDLIVSAQMPEDGWLISFLLSFGAKVDVIAPVYLRNVIAEQARQIYEKNKS